MDVSLGFVMSRDQDLAFGINVPRLAWVDVNSWNMMGPEIWREAEAAGLPC